LSKLIELDFIVYNNNNDISGFGLFHQAVKAKKNNRKCLKLLKETDCDVNLAEQRSGRTPLHMAVETNNIVVAGCLISEV